MKDLQDTLQEFKYSDSYERTCMIARGINSILNFAGFFANIGIAAYKGLTDQPLVDTNTSTAIQVAILAHSGVSGMIRGHESRLYKGHANYTPFNNFLEQGIGTPAVMAAIATAAYYAARSIR